MNPLLLKSRWLKQTAVLLFFLLTSATASGQSNVSNVDSSAAMRFAMIPFMGEPSSYIARSKGYFADEGLDMTFKENTAGKISLEDLFAGRVDIITIADTPLVYQAFNRDDFYIIAGITHSETIAGAVARRDHGISQPRDIKGKKIGLFKGTAADYLLDQYLLNYGISYSGLELVDMKPVQMVESLVSGDLDAIFSWQPHVHNAMKQLGDNAYRLPSKGIKTLDWVVVVMKDYAHRHPHKLVKFLRAQDRAIKFLSSNRQESIDIFASESGIRQDIVEALWDEFSFGLYLSESMLINFEDQARWMLKRRNDAGRIPNFLNYIYFDALDKFNPQAISVIR